MTATPTRTTAAAIYCRISLDLTGEGQGVERQREACLALARSRGWTVAPRHVYIENDTGASDRRKKRPVYDRMVADYATGQFDALVCWDLDRLTRQPMQLEEWIIAAEERGLMLATANGEADLSTDGGRMFARIKVAVAKQEVERKGARQRAANQQRAEQGKQPHTGRAFGYAVDGSVRPDEADALRSLYAQFAAGAGLHTLTRWLNDQGLPNTRGKSWTRAGVRDLLLNPRYIAERWLLRTTPTGRVREYVGPGNWEPLVSEEIFRAVGAILTDPARKESGKNGNARLYFGAGLYRCGICDDGTVLKTTYGTVYKTDGTKYQYRKFTCRGGAHLHRRADYVDEIVEAAISARLADPRIAAAMTGDRDAERVRALRDQAIGLRARRDGVVSDYADGIIDGRQLQVASSRIEAQLAEVERELAQIGAGTALGEVLAKDDPSTAWLTMDASQKAAVVDALATVTVMESPKGRRPSDTNTQKVAAWMEAQVASVRIDWR